MSLPRTHRIKHAGITGTIDSTIDKLTGEIAITGLDANTLAIGTVARVRETIEGQSRVASDVLGVMSPYDRAIVSFGARTPEGMVRFLPMDNDELGKTLGAIRFLAGGLDMNAGAANLQVLVRATSADDARRVFLTLHKVLNSSVWRCSEARRMRTIGCWRGSFKTQSSGVLETM